MAGSVGARISVLSSEHYCMLLVLLGMLDLAIAVPIWCIAARELQKSRYIQPAATWVTCQHLSLCRVGSWHA